MTVTLPTSTGKADWTNYTDYWREEDAEWLQERTVLRYADPTARAADWATPKAGQVTYNQTADRLELASGKTPGVWSTVQSFVNLTSTLDDATGVAISHKGAAGKGIVFEPGKVTVNHNLSVLGGVLTADATGVSIKTGTKVAKLTTDAANLVSDSPISAPGLNVTTLTAGSASLSGTLTVPNITMPGVLTGGTFKGAVDGTTVNGTGGTIGGVALSGNVASASAGFVSQGSFIRGDANMGYWSHRAANGTPSGPTVTVDATYVRFRVPNGIPVDNVNGGFTGAWIGGAIVSGGDPGAANFPNGTIWCS